MGKLFIEQKIIGCSMKMVCKHCGSDDVQVMAWVDINSKKLAEIPDKSSIWCSDCCDHTKTIEKINYENKK